MVIFRCPEQFQPECVRRALVPLRGIGTHNALRARLLSSLRHRAASEMQVEYLLVLPASTSDAARARQERQQTAELRAQAGVQGVVRTVLSDDVGAAIAMVAQDCDLLILGLSRGDRSRRVFAEIANSSFCDVQLFGRFVNAKRAPEELWVAGDTRQIAYLLEQLDRGSIGTSYFARIEGTAVTRRLLGIVASFRRGKARQRINDAIKALR